MRKLSKITALVMAFILFVTVSPMWSLNVNATENNNPDEQTQQIQQQGQDDDQQQGQGDDQQQGQEQTQQANQEQQQGQEQTQQGVQEQQQGQEQTQQGVQEQQQGNQQVEQQQGNQQVDQQQANQQGDQQQANQQVNQQGEQQQVDQQPDGQLRTTAGVANMVESSEQENNAAANVPALGAANEGDDANADGPEEEPQYEYVIQVQVDGATDDMHIYIDYRYLDANGDGEWQPGGDEAIKVGEFGYNYVFLLDEIDNNIPENCPFEFSVRIDNGGTDRHVVYANDNPWYNPEENPEEPEPKDLSYCLSNEGDISYFTYTFDDIEEVHAYHPFGLAMDYLNAGNPDILGESYGYLYAYGPGQTPHNELLARELYCRFISVPQYESFGLPVGDINVPEQVEIAEEGIRALNDRIYYEGNYSIDVIMADGSVQPRTVDIYRVEWGNAWDGSGAVVGYYDVINLANPEEIIVRTAAENPTYYARTAYRDEVSFVDGEEDYALLVYDAELGDGAAIGGNGCDVTLVAMDGGLLAADLNTPFWMSDAVGTSYGTRIRFLFSGNTYISVAGSGEGKAYGGLGVNGVVTDTIFTTGENAEARVYIGESVVYVEPLSVGNVINDGIASVALKDPSQAEGVILDTSDINKVKLTFKSNFYDTIPLTITYKSGVTKDITILRIGLLIQYTYLHGECNFNAGPSDDVLRCDFRDGECPFTYNYFEGQQVIVYATYYHPTNDLTAAGGDDLYLNVLYDDGHREIIPHTGYVAETDNEVGVSWFIIGYAPAKKFDGTVWTENIVEQTYVNKYGNSGGLSMTVLNAGFNNDTTFGGTQVGAGKGVHWDGKITWF